MITLDATTKKLTAVLDGTGTGVKFFGVWADSTATAFTPGVSDTDSNGTSAVDVVVAPGASTQRQVRNLFAYNGEASAKIVTLKLDNNGTARVIRVQSLAAGQTLDLLAVPGST
jgi:hypothetical protein